MRLPELFADQTAAALEAHQRMAEGEFHVGVGTSRRGQAMLDKADRMADQAIARAMLIERNLLDNPARRRKRTVVPIQGRAPTSTRVGRPLTEIGKKRAELLHLTPEQRAARRKQVQDASRQAYRAQISALAAELGITFRAAKVELSRRNKAARGIGAASTSTENRTGVDID